MCLLECIDIILFIIFETTLYKLLFLHTYMLTITNKVTFEKHKFHCFASMLHANSNNGPL